VKKAIFPLLVALAAAGLASDARVDWAAVRDSLREVEPWFRTRWLTERGLQDYFRANSWKPTADSGLRCVGRWSFGPSVKVSLRVTSNDTVVCLARGSGASIIRFRSHDSLTLQLLSDINCAGIVSRAIIQDTLVFCGMAQGGTGIEVWGASDPSSPNLLSRVSLPPVHDIAVKDSLLYTTAYSGDSLRIFNIADPRNPVQVGTCADSGDMMCVSGNYCYLGGQYGLFIVDVSNPASPHRVGSIGSDVVSVAVRDTLCFFGTTEFALRVYNVRNPSAPTPVGSLSGIEASDIDLPPTCDTVLYTPKLHVISIADPRNPRQIGFVDCPGWDFGVRAVPALNYALVADYFKGMVAVRITQPSAPTIDTMLFAGDQALDIYLDAGKAYVASYHAGLQILDVGNPAAPAYLGCYDTAGASRYVSSAAARDSFAFVSWPVPRMLSIDVTDPTRPFRAGRCDGMFGPPEDMVIRDSFVYCAEGRRLQVVNVARPRQPVLVGSCVTGDANSAGLCLTDTLAYVGNFVSDIVNVRNPASPQVVGHFGRGTYNVSVRDTFAFLSTGGIVVYSISDPAHPRPLDSMSVGPGTWWIEAVGSWLYTGNRDGVRVIDASDIHNMRVRGFCSTPYTVKRLAYVSPYVYASCWEAGVCIFESAQVAVGDVPTGSRPARLGLKVIPNPASGSVRLVVGEHSSGTSIVSVRDVLGKEVMQLTHEASDRSVCLDVTALPCGLYYVEVTEPSRRESVKFVKY